MDTCHSEETMEYDVCDYDPFRFVSVVVDYLRSDILKWSEFLMTSLSGPRFFSFLIHTN